MKFTYKRKLADTVGEDEAQRKRAGLRNAFPNPERSAQIARDDLGVDLGVVDRKYLEHGDGAGGLGREVSLTAAEVSGTVDLLEQVLSKVYQSLFTL